MVKSAGPLSFVGALLALYFVVGACGGGEVKTYTVTSTAAGTGQSGNQSGTKPTATPAPSASPSASGAPTALSGESLYTAKCGACHSTKAATTVDDKSVAGIKASYTNVPQMKGLPVPPQAEIEAISAYLLAK